MSTTGRQLVEKVLKKAGILATGENASADEASDALDSINLMLDSWSTHKLFVYKIEEESFSLVANQSAYTMGSGGDFNTTRPQEIVAAVVRDSNGAKPVDFPIRRIALREYAHTPIKGTTSDYPTELYYDGGNPLQTIKLYPTPSYAHSLVLWSLKPLTRIASLDTELAFPPGYERALVFNGAIEIAPDYGVDLPAIVGVNANDAMAAIKRANNKGVNVLRVDTGLTASGGRFNVYTGESG